MQPKLFNPDTFAGGSHGPDKRSNPTIRFHKQGSISLSIGLAKLLNLKSDDKVLFIQDEDTPSDWYLGKSEDGFIIRGKESSTLVFNHQRLRNKILESTGLDLSQTSIKMIISTKSLTLLEIEVYPIITESGRPQED